MKEYLFCKNALFLLVVTSLLLLIVVEKINASDQTAVTTTKAHHSCTDYPSCQLISPQMFESYCSRTTLKNMCPTYCDKKCKKVAHHKKPTTKKPPITHRTATSTETTPSKKDGMIVNKVTKPSTNNSPVRTTVRPAAAPQGFIPHNPLTTTKMPSKPPNATIFVPLFEAGFVQRVIPTSSKPDCDFTKSVVCKQVDTGCNKDFVWSPMTNDIPKEQLEILFNYTTDIYMLEVQGRVHTNETVTSFLFQYLNDAGVLISQIYRTETKSSSKINKFMFEPALRTNYIRITPIEFEVAIALRFEVYSKGILYNPLTA